MVAHGEHLNLRLGLAVLAAGTLGLIGFLVAGTNAQGATHQSVSSASVSLRTTKLGAILVNAKGRTLYLFTKDKSAKSSCSGMCAKYWPPAIARTKPTAGTGIKLALLGTTKRSDGTKQLTYNHHPLYGFALDKQAGQVNGQARPPSVAAGGPCPPAEGRHEDVDRWYDDDDLEHHHLEHDDRRDDHFAVPVRPPRGRCTRPCGCARAGPALAQPQSVEVGESGVDCAGIQPDGDVHGLHRATYSLIEARLNSLEIDGLAQPAAEPADNRFGVVAGAVETAADEPLDSLTQRIEQRRRGERRRSDTDRR